VLSMRRCSSSAVPRQMPSGSTHKRGNSRAPPVHRRRRDSGRQRTAAGRSRASLCPAAAEYWAHAADVEAARACGALPVDAVAGYGRAALPHPRNLAHAMRSVNRSMRLPAGLDCLHTQAHTCIHTHTPAYILTPHCILHCIHLPCFVACRARAKHCQNGAGSGAEWRAVLGACVSFSRCEST